MVTKNIFYFLIVCAVVSCKVDPSTVKPLTPVLDNPVQLIPDGWPQAHYKFEDNQLSEDRFALGRALFYETLLSKNDSISCGSCHQNFVAFANADHDLSHGIFERRGKRNAPGLFNLAWHTSFMHDGGSLNIENQPLAPLTNTLEMGEDINSVIAKLQVTVKYKSLFKSAYGDETVNSQRLLKSLAQFMGQIYSCNSKFDYYKRHEKNVQLTDQELNGYNLFQANCNSCHKEPLFSDFEFRSNGIPVDPVLNDNGREHITNQLQDRYKFKTPSLRNIALTYPYMHDGSFKTLEACLDHYTNASKNTMNLDPLLSKPLPLSVQDKKDIIVFLNTLTDYEFIKDERFADPNF